MSFVQQSLLKDEVIEYQANISPWAFTTRIIIGSLALFFTVVVPDLAIILLPFSIIVFGLAYLEYKSTELALTNKRIVAKFGFIKRETVELKLDKVESVQLGQGILGRILNFGDVIVAGAGTPKAPIPYIASPMKFRTRVFEIQDELEKQRENRAA